MNTQIQKTTQRIVATATGLVLVGVGLNILVMQTLGSFDAASVILALYLGFWAFVLGTSVLILSSVWLFIRRKFIVSQLISEKQQPAEHASVGLQAMCRSF